MVKNAKICPVCNNVSGGPAKICPKCDFDFSAAKKEQKLLKKQEKAASKSFEIGEKLKIKGQKEVEREAKEAIIAEKIKERKKVEKEAIIAEKLKIKEQKKADKEAIIAEKLRIKEQKRADKEAKIMVIKTVNKHDSLGYGKKKCPSCDIIMASASKICPKCQFDFADIIAEKKKLAEQKKEVREAKKLLKKSNIKVKKVEDQIEDQNIKISPLVSTISSDFKKEKVSQLNDARIEKAKEVLSKGPEYARVLLKHVRKLRCWDHIDWDYVAEQIGDVATVPAEE